MLKYIIAFFVCVVVIVIIHLSLAVWVHNKEQSKICTSEVTNSFSLTPNRIDIYGNSYEYKCLNWEYK